MVENINLHKRLFPASSTRKITALEKKQRNMQERRFKKYLAKDEEEDKKKEWKSKENMGLPAKKQKTKKTESDHPQRFSKKNSKTDSPHVNSIDIIV